MLKSCRAALSVLVVALAALTVPALASATTLPATCATLQAQLTAATAGDTVQLGTGLTCTGAYSLPATTGITFDGGGSTLVSLGDNGGAPAAVISANSAGASTIQNVVLHGAADTPNGDGIRIGSGSTMTIDHATITGFTSEIGSPSAINSSSASGTLHVNHSTLSDSRQGLNAYYGGPVFVADSTFANNETSGEGAAITMGYNNLSVTHSTFTNNTSEDVEGAISAYNSSSITLTGNTFTNNVLNSANTVNDVHGGAVSFRSDSGSLTQTGNTFVGNGVFHNSSTSSNLAGGAEYIAGGVTVHSTGDRFTGNTINGTSTGEVEGGALWIGADNNHHVPVAFLVNTVIAGNVINTPPVPGPSEVTGAAIYVGGPVGDSVALTVINDTIVDNVIVNQAAEAGGIDGHPADTLTLRNSIVQGNSGAQVEGFTTSASNRSIQTSDVCDDDGTTVLVAGNSNICADPEFADRNDFDYHETADSPTRNAGDNSAAAGLATDIEGTERILENVIDFGAYEYVGNAPTCDGRSLEVRAGHASAPTAPSCSDPDGDTLTYTLTTAPTHGTASLNSGLVTYTSTDADFRGTDSIGLSLDDGHGGTATTTLNVYVDAYAELTTTTAAPATAVAGSVVTYTVTVANAAGGDLVSDAVVEFAEPTSNTQASPAGQATLGTPAGCTANAEGHFVDCPVGALAGGASKTFTFTATFAANLPIGTTLLGSGNVYSYTTLEQVGDDESSASTKVVAAPVAPVVPVTPVVPPKDVTPPAKPTTGSIAALVATIKQVIAKGAIPTTVTVKESGITITETFTIDAKTRKLLHLKATKPLVLGTAKAISRRPGKVALTLKLSKAAKAALKATKLTKVPITVTVTLKDAAGNVSRSTSKVLVLKHG